MTTNTEIPNWWSNPCITLLALNILMKPSIIARMYYVKNFGNYQHDTPHRLISGNL